MRTGPRIYYLSPTAAGTIDHWSGHLRPIRRMNFDTVWIGAFYRTGASVHLNAVADHKRLDERFLPAKGAEKAKSDDGGLLRRFVQDAAALGLAVMIDLVLPRAARDAVPLKEHPEWCARDGLGEPRPFPGPDGAGSVMVNWASPAKSDLAAYFEDILSFYLSLGVRGFRCVEAASVPAAVWQRLIAAKRQEGAAFFVADTLGRPMEETLGLAGVGFDYVFNSVKWWDARSPWFMDQLRQLQGMAPTIGFPEEPAGIRLAAELGSGGDALRQVYHQRYAIAAAFSDGVVLPEGYETGSATVSSLLKAEMAPTQSGSFDIAEYIAAINTLKETAPVFGGNDSITALGQPGDHIQAYIKTSAGEPDPIFVVVNTDATRGYVITLDWLLATQELLADLEDLTPGNSGGPFAPLLSLEPAETRIYRAHLLRETTEPDFVPEASRAPSRVIVEAPLPSVDNSRFPAKRIVGDLLDVSADIYRDGHDAVSAAIRLREAGETSWRVAPMQFFDNDRWIGSIGLKKEGPGQYAVEAWTDHFGSWVAEVRKKRAANQKITLELIEGRELLAAAVVRAGSIGGRVLERLQIMLKQIDSLEDDAARADLMLSVFAIHAVGAVPDKSDRLVYEPAIDLLVERKGARYASWYEMFPRSQGTIPDRPGTFADCVKRLPEIRDLGFHVVYLVPIHPIGKTNRKGRDNSLIAGPGDPGSPYAIGAEAGGHDAVDPELGTIDDFRMFQKAVRDQGMEVALDFAVQCSPDHHWLREHPSWFRKRPDGSIKFAENPPKKYEDIVNVDFDSPDWREIWEALRDVVLFWVKEGVKIFRVDNPHTKPVAFWQWLIAEVKRADPDVLFLAEAFTRPKMMRRLAKIGFTQSYSYFTWRNTKPELIEYLTELTKGPSRDYYQPNFFANTPDILPVFLQTSGRPGFRIRLVLAATLSPVYGIYNGFELCESEAVPGKEEYAHSEKYQYKVWDWDRPGNIKDDVRRLNLLRERSPALQQFTNLEFHDAAHPDLLFYSKILSPSSNGGRWDVIFIAVNLNPFATVTAEIAFPLERMGLGEDASFETEELYTDERRRWTGRRHTVTLNPAQHPALVLRRVGE